MISLLALDQWPKNSLRYFVGYNDHDAIRPLCIRPPQMTSYVKHFGSNEIIFFKVTDKKLFKKYTKILLMNIEL